MQLFKTLLIILSLNSLYLTEVWGQAQGNTSNVLTPVDTLEEIYTDFNYQNFRKKRSFKVKIDFDKINYDKLNACIFFMTNELRKKYKVTSLSYSSNLEIAAWYHAKNMHEKNFFSHHNPHDPKCETPTKRAKLAGIVNPKIAENIALRSKPAAKERISYIEFAEELIKQWMSSPGHRKNLLSDKALATGVGIYIGERGVYAVQTFQWYKPLELTKSTDSK